VIAQYSSKGMFVLLLLPFCLVGQSKYPDWFLYPQKYQTYICGYSTADLVPSIKDAIWRYSLYKDGFLVGRASYFNDEDRWEKKYYLEANKELLAPDILTKLDRIPTSIYRGGEEIALYTLKKNHDSNIFKSELILPSRKKPEWLARGPFFESDGYYYSIGDYVLRGNENDAWRETEERGIRNLASAIGVTIEHTLNTVEPKKVSGVKSDIATENIEILTYIYDHHFTGIEIIERWLFFPESDPDANLQAYTYVLMRIPIDNIKYNYQSTK
jgi:hypothetical protein